MKDYPFEVNWLDSSGKVRFDERALMWCGENLEPQSWAIIFGQNKLYFKNEQDAMMFTLRWC